MTTIAPALLRIADKLQEQRMNGYTHTTLYEAQKSRNARWRAELISLIGDDEYRKWANTLSVETHQNAYQLSEALLLKIAEIDAIEEALTDVRTRKVGLALWASVANGPGKSFVDDWKTEIIAQTETQLDEWDTQNSARF